jgi:hypothetical protein
VTTRCIMTSGTCAAVGLRRNFAAVKSLALLLAGCVSRSDCPTTVDDATSTADLAGTGVASSSSTWTDFGANEVETSLAYVDESDANDHCLGVRFTSRDAGYSIDMHCPSALGTYRLEDLGAQFCEARAGVGGGGCAMVTGTLVKRTRAPRVQPDGGRRQMPGVLAARVTSPT